MFTSAMKQPPPKSRKFEEEIENYRSKTDSNNSAVTPWSVNFHSDTPSCMYLGRRAWMNMIVQFGVKICCSAPPPVPFMSAPHPI